MAKPLSTRSRGTRRQPEASRSAILQAALAEFAQEGLAGARMDAIAASAGVNKALLYYYFRDKDALYGAVLDGFFAQLLDRIVEVCDRPGGAGIRFLAYVRTHFDSIAESPYYAHIFMGELMSATRGGSAHLNHLFPRYLRPIAERVLRLLQEGVDSGEFRQVDVAQFFPSTMGAVTHYFLTAPLRQKFMQDFPGNAHSLQQRRAAVLDFVAAALFSDRAAGVKLAAKVAAKESGPPSSREQVRAQLHRESMRRKS